MMEEMSDFAWVCVFQKFDRKMVAALLDLVTPLPSRKERRRAELASAESGSSVLLEAAELLLKPPVSL